MRIAIICLPTDDVINFEINFSFLMKSFDIETKSMSHHFKGLSLKRIKQTFQESKVDEWKIINYI